MKFTFRKIASVLASTVMLSSTVALAAAANYPSPFVKSGVADVAVVYGANALNTDVVAALDITSDLQAELAVQTASTSSATSASTVEGGDFVQLATSTNAFNLGEDLNDFYSSLDSDELSNVLADGVYTNDENDEFDYDQKIELGSLQLKHFQDNDFNSEKPVVGFDLVDGDHVLNYTLDFSPDPVEGGTGLVDLETTDLTMLGRSYYVVDATYTSNGIKLSLLDSANSAVVTEGEATSVKVGDTTYDISVSWIDSDEVILVVNGVTTNKLGDGDVFKVATDTYVAVKSVLYNEKEAGISKVEISIGSGKIVMENGQEIKVNNEDVSDIDKYNDAEVKAFITNSSGTANSLDKVVLMWDLGDDAWLAPGSDLVLPAFETIKLSMAGFTSPKQETTKLANDGEESITLETNVEDGAVKFNLLYNNATQYLGLGKDSNDRLVTSASTSLSFNMSQDEWFVASWLSGDNAESYVLKVTDITDSDPAKNTTTIESQASGSSEDLSLDINEADSIGNVKLTLSAANEKTGVAAMTISAASGTGSVSFNRLYTKEGLRIMLPVSNSTTVADGNINLTSAPTSFVMNFTEEDENGNIVSGSSFTATLGKNTDGEAQVSSVSVTDYETEEGSDKYEGYVSSKLATKTLFSTGSDQDTLDIVYAGEESFADVYVSETGAVVTASEGTTTTGTVAKLGSVSVSDAEAASVASKNLIVVGGSCINSVAAELLGGALCGANFESSTGVGAGSFLIQTFERTGGKVATLVAGYNAEDTTNAAKYLTTQAVDTTVGKKYKGTSATSASLVTEQSTTAA